MDKAFWASILERKGAVPDGHTPAGLLPELLANLGSADPELRDELSLEVLCGWVIDGKYSPDELRGMAATLIDNLRVGIRLGESDQVFLRTFSALVLRWVVDYDGKRHVFAGEELRGICDAALAYLADEADWRGYVPDKGWAHSVAHTADLLVGLAEHPGVDSAQLERILTGIAAKVTDRGTVYPLVDMEGFRLARVVLAVAGRGALAPGRLGEWLKGIGESAPEGFSWRTHIWRHNAVALLSALQVVLSYGDCPPAAARELFPALHSALRFFLPHFLRPLGNHQSLWPR